MSRSAASNAGKGWDPSVLERRYKGVDDGFSVPVLPPACAAEKGARREFRASSQPGRARPGELGPPGPAAPLTPWDGDGTGWGWGCPCRFPAGRALLLRQGRALRPAPQLEECCGIAAKSACSPTLPKKGLTNFCSTWFALVAVWLRCT